MASENKYEKGGVFFACDFDVVFSPRLPRIPPRFHHQKTTTSHDVFAKTPAKTHLHHNRKKLRGKRQICIQPTHGVAHPTAGKEASFLQPAHVLYHRGHHHRLDHAVSDLPAKSKRHNPKQQRARDPAVIDELSNNPAKNKKTDSKESAFLLFQTNNDRTTNFSTGRAIARKGNY
jgi:hypothetical protein